ncbi:unnamed protein product, partial [Oppiella nova]
ILKFQTFLLVVLLFICSCTYLHGVFPACEGAKELLWQARLLKESEELWARCEELSGAHERAHSSNKLPFSWPSGSGALVHYLISNWIAYCSRYIMTSDWCISSRDILDSISWQDFCSCSQTWQINFGKVRKRDRPFRVSEQQADQSTSPTGSSSLTTTLSFQLPLTTFAISNTIAWLPKPAAATYRCFVCSCCFLFQQLLQLHLAFVAYYKADMRASLYVRPLSFFFATVGLLYHDTTHTTGRKCKTFYRAKGFSSSLLRTHFHSQHTLSTYPIPPTTLSQRSVVLDLSILLQLDSIAKMSSYLSHLNTHVLPTRHEYLQRLFVQRIRLSSDFIDKEKTCMLCQTPFTQHIVNKDDCELQPALIHGNHHACRMCVLKWLVQERKNKCPFCRLPLYRQDRCIMTYDAENGHGNEEDENYHRLDYQRYHVNDSDKDILTQLRHSPFAPDFATAVQSRAWHYEQGQLTVDRPDYAAYSAHLQTTLPDGIRATRYRTLHADRLSEAVRAAYYQLLRDDLRRSRPTIASHPVATLAAGDMIKTLFEALNGQRMTVRQLSSAIYTGLDSTHFDIWVRKLIREQSLPEGYMDYCCDLIEAIMYDFAGKDAVAVLKQNRLERKRQRRAYLRDPARRQRQRVRKMILRPKLELNIVQYSPNDDISAE